MGIQRSDVRYALRLASRTPMLTLIIIVTLSIGIGSTVGAFNLLDGIWFRNPAVGNSDKFVTLFASYSKWAAGADRSSFTWRDYDAFSRRSHAFRDLAGYTAVDVNLDKTHRQIRSELITCNYFDVYGLSKPVRGRLFGRQECAPGTKAPIVVLSEQVWRRDFAADPTLIGKSIRLSGQVMVVVGIAPADFSTPATGSAWIPYTMEPSFLNGKNGFENNDWPWLTLAGRLNDGYSREAATAEIRYLARQQDSLNGERQSSVNITNGSLIEDPSLHAFAFAIIPLILGPLALVLLVASTNISMLLLAKAVVRRGEVATRLALGMSRNGIFSLLLADVVLLTAPSALLGAIIAWKLPQVIWSTIAPDTVYGSTQLDGALLACIAIAVLFVIGVVMILPLRDGLRVNLSSTLRSSQSLTPTGIRIGTFLVILQLGVSFLLIVGAGIFTQLYFSINSINPGFDVDRIVLIPLDIRTPEYSDESAETLYKKLQDQVAGLTEVESSSYQSVAPFGSVPRVRIKSSSEVEGKELNISMDVVSPAFFTTFGIPLLAGKTFTDADASTGR
jgi:predicted permease